jgi:hypothetical protein
MLGLPEKKYNDGSWLIVKKWKLRSV